MKIEIKKHSFLDGSVRYRVYMNNLFDEGFASEEEAIIRVDTIKSNFNKGLPKDEIILSETI